MRGLELVVVLGVAVLVGSLVARRYRVAPPVLLFGCGVLLGFIPHCAGRICHREAMLFLFLPALLFWESLTTSLREIRRNLRGIILARTVLVIATAAAVAAVAHALGLPWGPAWVLGAAVAPTDATAVAALARTAFLLAEVIHASGVLAVVVCGLVISRVGPRVIQADARQTTVAFWSLSTFLLNGVLFVLVGLELQSAIRGLTSVALARGIVAVGAVTAVIIGVRFAWIFITTYLIRLLDRRPNSGYAASATAPG